MMFGSHGFMGGVMWLFWIAVIIGLFFLIKWIVEQSHPAESKPEMNSLEILKNRYASGEIDKHVFEQKKNDLLS